MYNAKREQEHVLRRNVPAVEDFIPLGLTHFREVCKAVLISMSVNNPSWRRHRFMTYTESRKNLELVPIAGKSIEIGKWLWILGDTRRRTLENLGGLDPAAVDWQPGWAKNTIGSLLYHLAAIEASWFYEDILQELPDDLDHRFPYDVRDEAGVLAAVRGTSIENHLSRLEKVRHDLMQVLIGMSAAEFHRKRTMPDYDVTPDWVLHHLVQHEAEH
jgi:uncharacterized damage-inducible protein DinB